MTPRKVLEVLRAELASATPDVVELDAVLGAVPVAAGWDPVWDYLVERAGEVFSEPTEVAWIALWMCAQHARERSRTLDAAQILAAAAASPWPAALETCGALCRGGRLRGEQLGVAVVRHPIFTMVESARVRETVLGVCRVALAANFIDGDADAAGRLVAAVRGAPAWNPPSWGETGLALYVRAGVFRSLHATLETLGAAWVWDRAAGGRALDRLAPHGPLDRYARDAMAAAACAALRSDWVGALLARGTGRFERAAVEGVARLAQARSVGAMDIHQPDAHGGAVAALTAAEALVAVGDPARARQVAVPLRAELGRLPGSEAYLSWARRVGV